MGYFMFHSIPACAETVCHKHALTFIICSIKFFEKTCRLPLYNLPQQYAYKNCVHGIQVSFEHRPSVLLAQSCNKPFSGPQKKNFSAGITQMLHSLPELVA